MANVREYKTPVLASRFIKDLKEKNLKAEVRDDEDCYPTIERARIVGEAGDRCCVQYWTVNPEEYDSLGYSAGNYYFTHLGVVCKANRTFNGEEDWTEVDFSGRAIKYDMNPETREPYTEAEIVEAMREYVDYKAYDSWDYELELDKKTLKDIEEKVDSLNERTGQYFARDSFGDVYLFDNYEPMPQGEGFKRMSEEAGIHRIVSILKNVEEGYY